MDDSSEEDGVEKDVAFLAKIFQKFLKMNNSGKPFNREKFSSSKGDRKEFKKKDGRIYSLIKAFCVMNAMAMGISRRKVPTI